jgi:hypothetical protein
LLINRSDSPLPEVHRPSHMTPSSHLQPHDYRPNLYPTISETLSSFDSDDHATLADLVKGKTGGVELLACEGSPGPEAGISCPKKLRTTMWKRRASGDVR